METKQGKVMCPKCGIRPAPIHPQYGVLWCDTCNQAKGPTNFGGAYEFVPESIKEDRIKYKRDIVQPYRDGKASKEFIDTYPQKAKRMFTPSEIRHAKPVWKDVAGWKGYQ